MKKAILIMGALAVSGCAAMNDPAVWGPMAGAAVLQIGDADEDLAEHLSDHTPVFGSRDSADEWSDMLRDATEASYIIAGFSSDESVTDDAILVGVQFLSGEVVSYGTDFLKDTTDRERPDGSDNESLPSGHATTSAYRAGMASHNIDRTTASHKSLMKAGVNTMAIGASYARVEAGVHYPSDVLVGYALGTLYSNAVTPYFSRRGFGFSFNYQF